MASCSSSDVHSSLDSDSESDVEPNARGSHLFWGNLKTPEKSRSVFVDPPQTVIRTHTVSPTTQSPQLSINLPPSEPEISDISSIHQMTDDVTVSNAIKKDIRYDINDKSTEMISYDVVREEVSSDVDEILVDSILCQITPQAPAVVSISEIQIEEPPALQSSSHSPHSRVLETPSMPINQYTSEIFRDEMDTESAVEEQKPKVSDTFDFSILGNSPPINLSPNVMEKLPPTSTQMPHTETSSYSHVDNMPPAVLSTLKTPGLPSSDEATVHPSNTEGWDVQNGSGSNTLFAPSVTSLSNPPCPTIDKSDLGTQHHERVEKTNLGTNIPNDTYFSTPNNTLSGPASLAETRKRSPDGMKGTIDNISSTGSPIKDGDLDQLIKKERRIKAKREMERTRQQLLSLSPASTGLLNLLASPTRDSPIQFSPQRGLDSSVSDIMFEVGHIGGAGRVLVPTSSLQRPPGSPLRLVSPGHISLDDPSRTPARRDLVTSHSVPSHPRALNDPECSPSRRVPALPSPMKQGKSPELSATLPQIRVVPRFFSKKQMTSPTKAPAIASSSIINAAPHSASSAIQAHPANQLPFPLVSGKSNADAGAGSSSIQPSVSTTSEQATSTLRQPSSITADKASRLQKPYSRLAQLPSRLPMASCLRRTAPSVSTGGHPTSTTAVSSRSQAPASSLAPSRIPSPVKRGVLNKNPSSTSASSVETVQMVNSHKRKRQGESSDGECDEPPFKRSIVVQSEIKIAHKVGRSAEGLATKSSPIRQVASPIRCPRPLNSVQIRTVIPGTLRHFETTRSSSRDLLKEHRDNRGAPPRAVSEDPPCVSNTDREDAPAVWSSSRTRLQGGSVLSSSDFPDRFNHPELRRTTRVRKPQAPDISSADTSNIKREPVVPKRRNTGMVQRPASTSKAPSSKSSTRSATPLEEFPTNPRLLQTLTDANTMRNQTYIANLERSIIRKTGPRPPSPTTKVRTILEKSKEERSKEREIRAERRRRRDQGSNVTDGTDLDDINDVPSSPSPTGLTLENGPLKKHARGPGDDEDYESPERPPKASKLDPTRMVKTVKWDRSLSRTLSELEVENLAAVKLENAARKANRRSCLARSLRLDPLGNIPEADIPLENLGKPHVIVTRFVYDDDIEELPPRAAKKKKS